jgi:hypothetical protein
MSHRAFLVSIKDSIGAPKFSAALPQLSPIKDRNLFYEITP